MIKPVYKKSVRNSTAFHRHRSSKVLPFLLNSCGKNDFNSYVNSSKRSLCSWVNTCTRSCPYKKYCSSINVKLVWSTLTTWKLRSKMVIFRFIVPNHAAFACNRKQNLAQCRKFDPTVPAEGILLCGVPFEFVHQRTLSFFEEHLFYREIPS